MNVQEYDIMNVIQKQPLKSQRELAQLSGYSVGLVNQTIKKLKKNHYLQEDGNLTKQAIDLFAQSRPKRAIILAAGFGMRMVPINTEIPKGLIEVKGEILIERLIRQLQEVGIHHIIVVVGFMKERYDYLIDEFNVELVVNSQYATKNNLHSLYLVKEYLKDSYIIPCDVWAKENPFSSHELYAWYMISERETQESSVRVNRKRELVLVSEEEQGNQLLGIAYITSEVGSQLQEKLEQVVNKTHMDHAFWETILRDKQKWILPAKMALEDEVIEINTYEQLRELDSQSTHLQTEAIEIIQDVLQVSKEDIVNITVLKKGMTNRSFLFECQEKKYIMRIPGEGTDRLMNRQQEAAVYQALDGLDICDDVLYMDAETGYKITVYLENTRTCDPKDWEDVSRCMAKLRSFHHQKLTVNHRFDLFKQIEFYETLWGTIPSYYKDYAQTKEQVMDLKSWLDTLEKQEVLVHIDAVADNFLFVNQQEIRLIDWEYAGMQDPHLDVAMFCIYAMYTRVEIDRLIDLYFEGSCLFTIRLKIYAYIAIAGLLWSNWCEYKRNLGIDFGEYSLKQYRYAKEYSRIVHKTLEKLKTEEEKNGKSN